MESDGCLQTHADKNWMDLDDKAQQNQTIQQDFSHCFPIDAELKYQPRSSVLPCAPSHPPPMLNSPSLSSSPLLPAGTPIFQGLSAALEAAGYHRGKHGIATLIHIASMDPHLIAYIAVQVSDLKNSMTIHFWFHKPAFPFHHPNNGRNLMDHSTTANFIGLFDDGKGQDIIDFYNQWVPHSICWHISWHRLQSYLRSTIGSFNVPGTTSNHSVESDFNCLKVQATCSEACSCCSCNRRSRQSLAVSFCSCLASQIKSFQFSTLSALNSNPIPISLISYNPSSYPPPLATW